MLGLVYWLPAVVFVVLLVLHHGDIGVLAVGIYSVLAVVGGVVIVGILRMPLVVLAGWMSLLALVLYFQVKLRALNL